MTRFFKPVRDRAIKLVPVTLLLLTLSCLEAQIPGEEPWISYPTASVTDYGVYHFRKTFRLQELPASLIVHISADNRYHLYVNGSRVCYGPAKGDLTTYKYDVVDVAPYLRQGENLLAILVYNSGKDKPMALLSAQTALMVRPEDPSFRRIATDATWKTFRNPAYEPVSYQEMLFDERWFYGYYACGPGDRVRGDRHPWGWEQPGFDDRDWRNAEVLSFDGNPPWNLVPRNIPYMDDHPERPARIRLQEGVTAGDGFPEGATSVRICPDSRARILLDYEVLTMGYPELTVSGGRGSAIRIRYAEALYEKVNLKAHRDSVRGKTMFGVWDDFYPDGGPRRIFRPLWKRTFRYVQLEIITGGEPLEIHSFKSEYSGYPYPEMSTFRCNDERLNEIFRMGLRTLGMCSGETYYDTPFYEQLSYGGDNRPIAALSTYNSTDDRLLREVMRLYPQSENNETELFKSAYPSRFDFDMGSWSLAWIQSLYDYCLVRGDTAFAGRFTDKIEGVLGYYHRHMDESMGILGPVNSRNFIDWSITRGSIPRRDENGIVSHSTLLTLYYLHTLDCVVDLYRLLGIETRAEKWRQEARLIRQSVQSECWDQEAGLYADYPDLYTDCPERKVYSQHTNIMAILCSLLPENRQAELMERILEYDGFTEYASSYFSFFLFKAMQKTGMEDRFLDHLGFWYRFLDMGHTTCGETGFDSHDRSDCHAWSAHPSYFLLSIVCGINRDDIGFNRVVVSPHLGPLTRVSASMPHPAGRIKVAYNLENGTLTALIVLPERMEGEFRYEGRCKKLIPGENRFQL